MREHTARGRIDPVIFEADRCCLDNRIIKFPCPCNGNMVTYADCFDCHKSNRCDIYATMLDENFDD